MSRSFDAGHFITPGSRDSTYRRVQICGASSFFSLDGGASWTDLTGNLPSISSQDFRTIEFYPSAQGARVALGTRSGVYQSLAGSDEWSTLGAGLPDVLVFDMRYVEATGSLIAGTLGRGVFQLPLVRAAAVFSDGFE